MRKTYTSDTKECWYETTVEYSSGKREEWKHPHFMFAEDILKASWASATNLWEYRVTTKQIDTFDSEDDTLLNREIIRNERLVLEYQL